MASTKLINITLFCAVLCAPTLGAQVYTEEKMKVVGAYEFVSENPDYPMRGDGAGVWATGPVDFRALLDLPDGAVVTRMSLDSCNAADITSINFYLSETCNWPCVTSNPQITIGSQTEGVCERVSASYSIGEMLNVDNEQKIYYLVGHMPHNDGSDRFSAVRVYYRQAVAPEPSEATFSDVPVTHPLYRFVEALAAAGITSGCGDGKFCPDAPLTRGQIAVFLTMGLGLSTPVD